MINFAEVSKAAAITDIINIASNFSRDSLGIFEKQTSVEGLGNVASNLKHEFPSMFERPDVDKLNKNKPEKNDLHSNSSGKDEIQVRGVYSEGTNAINGTAALKEAEHSVAALDSVKDLAPTAESSVPVILHHKVLEGINNFNVAFRNEFPSLFERPDLGKIKDANLEQNTSSNDASSKIEQTQDVDGEVKGTSAEISDKLDTPDTTDIIDKPENIKSNTLEGTEDNEIREMTIEDRQVLKDNFHMADAALDKCEVDPTGKADYKLTCINEDRNGYKEEIVKGDEGIKLRVKVPEFEGYKTFLSKELRLASDKEQFTYATSKLKEAIIKNPSLVEKYELSSSQVEAIMKNSPRIPGKVWHHGAQPGEMQLVDSKTHNDVRHTGGRTIWSGGQANR